MKVKDLIEELQKLNPELEVIKQKDDEGNGFHRLHIVDDNAYIEKGDKSYYLDVLEKEDAEDSFDVPQQVCVLV